MLLQNIYLAVITDGSVLVGEQTPNGMATVYCFDKEEESWSDEKLLYAKQMFVKHILQKIPIKTPIGQIEQMIIERTIDLTTHRELKHEFPRAPIGVETRRLQENQWTFPGYNFFGPGNNLDWVSYINGRCLM